MTDPAPETERELLFEAFADTLGHKDKDRNGDAFALDSHCTGRILLAVADGVSSSPSDHDASRCACAAALTRLQAAGPDGGTESLLSEAVEAAHQAVGDLPDPIRGSLTTLLLADVDRRDGRALFVSVGDSRVYRVGSGEAECLTRDDSTSQVARKQGKPWIRDGVVVTRKFLTQAVGQVGPLEIRIQETRLEPGDLLVLATDGFHELPQFLSRLQILQRYLDLPSASARVLMEYLRDAGRDDGTVGLVRRVDFGPREAARLPADPRAFPELGELERAPHLAGRICMQRMRRWAVEGDARNLILAVEALRARDIRPDRREVLQCADLLKDDGQRQTVVAWQGLVEWAGLLLEGTDGPPGG